MSATYPESIIDVLTVGNHRALEVLRQLTSHIDDLGARNPWFRLWVEHSSRYVDLGEADAALAQVLPPNSNGRAIGGLLFAAQTYASLVLDAMARLLGAEQAFERDRVTLFDWYRYRHEREYVENIRRICDSLKEHEDFFAAVSDTEFSALLGATFQQIFPPKLRHLLGEYYTPEWLIDDASELLDPESLPSELVLLDPAAGSGGFAIRLLSRLLERREFERVTIVLSDVSPIATRFAELNVTLFNLRAAQHGRFSVQPKVLLADTICDAVAAELPLFGEPRPFAKLLGTSFSDSFEPGHLEQALVPLEFVSANERTKFKTVLGQILCDQFFFRKPVAANVICGNPPWISWDGVITEYRRTLAQQWGSSSLVTNKGWRAKVAAGKHDLSTLFVYRSAERHAAPGATMVFALPISVFQGRHSSAGFRLFRAGPRRYSVTTVLDLASADVFADALNRASLGVFRVDQEPSYPIRYGRLVTGSESAREYEWGRARPIDARAEGSPIVLAEDQDEALFDGIAPSEYRARGGVNTGGGNAVFWVDCLDREGERTRVVNSGKSKGVTIRQIEGLVETACVAPLLVGRDIRRWRAVPSRHILFLYDKKNPKHAIPEKQALERFPLAVRYLEQFESELRGRKEYHRWGASGPFYELYRIGPYTFAEVKVVWQHTGFRGRMNVAVIKQDDGSVIVPDQKVILLPFSSEDEAHYVCAYLASEIVEQVLRKYIGLDASTHILDYISLRRYDPRNAHHVRLSELSMKAHALADQGGELSTIEREIDSVAEKLFLGLRKAA